MVAGGAVGQRHRPAVGRGRVGEDRLGLGLVDDVIVGQREQERLADGKCGEARGAGTIGHGTSFEGWRAGPSAGQAGVHRSEEWKHSRSGTF